MLEPVAAISVSGDGLAYNSGTGAISLTADTGDIAEGSNLYFTDARARAALNRRNCSYLVIFNF